jgi:hypothetical protein
MKKKYIIVVSIVIVLWGAFMVYRHHKKKHDTGGHRQKASNRATEIAKKSPRAGLAQMGMALKRYHAKNQAYPSSLMDLHPNYLANKSLIEEIDWYYEVRGDSFYQNRRPHGQRPKASSRKRRHGCRPNRHSQSKRGQKTR